MESVASSSTPPPNHHHHHQRHRFSPTQPLSNRITRALHDGLRLLHRSDTHFFILGATGNVYTVNISSTPSCTCPDRVVPCKHILFVFIRVLGVSLNNSCLWRRTLRPCQLHGLLDIPTSVESLAGAAVRKRFHQLFSKEKGGCSRPPVVVADCDGACPVCLEEMKRDMKVVTCGTCKNMIHEQCFLAWKRSCGRRSATCVLCRARWRNNGGDQDQKYLNLSAYVNENDLSEENGRCND